MKTLYTILAACALLFITPVASHASGPYTETPTENASKAATREKAGTLRAAKKGHKKNNTALRMRRFTSGLNHAFLVFLGMEDSKAVTSPAKLTRQLHAHQKHLKAKTRLEAKARRRRTEHQFH